jgi:hypothetical protein
MTCVSVCMLRPLNLYYRPACPDGSLGWPGGSSACRFSSPLPPCRPPDFAKLGSLGRRDSTQVGRAGEEREGERGKKKADGHESVGFN